MTAIRAKKLRPNSRPKIPAPQTGVIAAAGDSHRLLDCSISIAIVLITSAAFFPVLANGFVNIDDRVNLLNNLNFRGLDWAQLQWMFTTLHNSLYRPVTWMTFGLDYLLWGIQPFGYHLTSLLFHCANAAVVYFLALRLLRFSDAKQVAQGDLSLRAGAAFAALVFAVHPLRVEVVAWASARNDVVAGLFFISTILCYLRAVEAGAVGGTGAWRAATLVLYALSLLAKPNGITLPFALLVLDVYPLQRLGWNGKWFDSAARQVWFEKVPFLALSVGAGALALVAKEQSKLLADLDHYGWLERCVQSIYSAAFYLWKSILPLTLSPLYELPVHFQLTDGFYWMSAVLILSATVMLYIFRRKWPAGMAGWVIYLVILAPVSGIVQNGPQFAADRYSYLSCLPWAILAGFAMRKLWPAQLHGGLGRPTIILPASLAGLIILSLTVLTWKQSQVWRDAETLWRHALAVDDQSFFAHQFLGTALFDRRKSEEALAHFRRALAINPYRASAYNNMGLVLAERGDTKDAIQFYQQAIRLDPHYTLAHFNLARLLAIEGLDLEAIRHYRSVLDIRPDNADARNDLGLLLESQGDGEAAQAEFERAIRLNPNHDKAFFNLAELMNRRGDLANAAKNYQQAARINPKEAAFQIAWAAVLARQGELEGATNHLLAAVKLQPDNVNTHVLLARSLAAQGKIDQAEKHYREALRLAKEQGTKAGSGSQIPK